VAGQAPDDAPVCPSADCLVIAELLPSLRQKAFRKLTTSGLWSRPEFPASIVTQGPLRRSRQGFPPTGLPDPVRASSAVANVSGSLSRWRAMVWPGLSWPVILERTWW